MPRIFLKVSFVIIFLLILFLLCALFFFIPFDEIAEQTSKESEKMVVAGLSITLIMVEIFLAKSFFKRNG